MSLNIDDIYNNLESFRNKHDYTLDEMAKLIGLSNKSSYKSMLKTKSMKLEYIVNLLSNSDMTVERLFGLSRNYIQTGEITQVNENKSSEPHQKRIQELEEICELQRKLIREYELQLGKKGKANCG